MSEETSGGTPADLPAKNSAGAAHDAAAGAAPNIAASGVASGPAPSSGLAIATLVMGIVAIVMAIIPFVSFVAFVPALVAVGLGIAALVKKAGKAKSVIGLVLGALAFFIAIGVSVSTASLISGTSASLAEADGGSAAVTAPSGEPSTDQQAPSVEPSEAAPEPVAIPEDKAYKGSGDKVLSIELPDGADSAAVATISYSGESNFAVWSLDSGLVQKDLLVNEIGSYSGTVVFNLRGDATKALEITASGDWTVTVRSVLSLREFEAGVASGHADDVLVYRGPAGVATIVHSGSSNFAIWSYGDRSDLVVNEIGDYSGESRWMTGPSLVAVTADGDWSISVAGI